MGNKRIDDQADHGGGQHHHWLGQLLETPQDRSGGEKQCNSGQVHDGPLAQHHHGSSDSAHGSGGNAINERDHAGVFAVLLEVRRRDHSEEVAGQEGRRCRDNCAPETAC